MPRRSRRVPHCKLLLVVALGLMPCLASGQQPEPSTTIKKRTELVLIPAIVEDAHGKHVSGLSRQDFTILENGKPQEIKVFDEVTKNTQPPPAAAQRVPNEFTNKILPAQSNNSRVTVIAFDLINMPTLRQANARQALWDLLSEASSSMDPTAVYSIGSRGVGVVLDFTSDPRLLREALDRLKLGRRQAPTTSQEGLSHAGPMYNSENDQNTPTKAVVAMPKGAGQMGMVINQMEKLQQEVEMNVNSQLTRQSVLETLSGLQQIAQACAQVPGRKALLWVTGGFPFDPSPTDQMIHGQEATFRGGRADWSDMYDDYQRTWRALTDAQVVLYPIDVRGLTNPRMVDPSVRNLNRLEGAIGNYADLQTNSSEQSFADATGGQAFFGNADLKPAFQSAMSDSDEYYMLGYYVSPDEHSKKGWHPVSVKMVRPGLRVRARAGYFYQPTQADLDAARERDLNAAVFSPLNFTSVTLTARWTGTAQTDTGKQVGFGLVMAPAIVDREGASGRIRLTIVAHVKTLEGKPVRPTYSRVIEGDLGDEEMRRIAEQGFSYAGELNLPPGDYMVRFVVRDDLTGRMGSLTAPLTVTK